MRQFVLTDQFDTSHYIQPFFVSLPKRGKYGSGVALQTHQPQVSWTIIYPVHLVGLLRTLYNGKE